MIKILFNKKKTKTQRNQINLFIIILYIYIFLLKLNKQINNKIKVCICTIGKKENIYIREYIDYYKKLAMDQIYIYDNNEINGESFESVIFDYIKINYVKIINYRGYLKPQIKMMNSCYKMNYLKYDWIIFNDIDEFLYLKNYSNIKNFLNEPKFNKCKIIYLNFIFYTDNNNLYYENKTVISRFKERSSYNNGYWGKSIIRGNISSLNITSPHSITSKIPACNGFGKLSRKFKIDSEYYYFKHYSFKSTEEYCNKLNKGNVAFDNNNQKKLSKINMYFQFNKITIDKIKELKSKNYIY
jgi:hypothetical protein